MSPFRPHGRAEAYIQGRVLITHCWDHWNIEMHRENAARGAVLAHDLDVGGLWGAVVVVHNSLVTSLEVLEAGRDAVARMPADKKLVALAWAISPDVEGYSFLLNRYKEMYLGLLNTRVFEDQASAVYWVERIVAELGGTPNTA